MTQFLPPNLLALFAPRDPIPYLAPLDKLPFEKKNSSYTGVGAYLNLFEDPNDTPEPVKLETKDERLERKRREKTEQIAYKLEQGIALWEPLNNPTATSDPFKTLFVARINYDSTESKLRREFETYGPVRKINVVHNRENGKPRGYAFIEYEHERDMHSAYKHADGKKIDGRRVLVDVERARTVKGWLPRRLGGGLGGTRRGGPDVNVKHSGREELRAAVVGAGDERDRERRRSRSRTPIQRERRRRSRTRSRDRDTRRRERKRRSSHERSRDKDRDKGDGSVEEAIVEGSEMEDRKDRIIKRRSRSRERPERGERERKRSKRGSRSRSRDRERKRRDRGERGERDRGERRDRGDREKPVQIKEEPVDDGYENNGNDNENDDSYGYSGSQYDEYSRDGTNDAGQYNSYYSATSGIKTEPPE